MASSKLRTRKQTFEHIPGLDISAVFSKCGNYRYLLKIRKKDSENKNSVCVILQNPSIANETYADKSVQFLEKLVFEKESKLMQACELQIVNQFAYIKTKGFEGQEQQVGPLNDTYIQSALKSANLVLLAWGKTNPFQDRKKQILDFLAKLPEKKVFITSCHPSRGHYKNFITPWKP